jgi:dihydropyrimidine dehydrogenase (NAD+) subunit PreA
VKPIALHMVAQLAREGELRPAHQRHRRRLQLARRRRVHPPRQSSSVQVCTEVMLRGYRIVEDMIEGLDEYMRDKASRPSIRWSARPCPNYSEWGDLDLNYETSRRSTPTSASAASSA